MLTLRRFIHSSSVVHSMFPSKKVAGSWTGSKYGYPLIGVTVGTLAGGILAWREFQSKQMHTMIVKGSSMIQPEVFLDKKPPIPPSKSVRFVNERNNGLKFTLYQYNSCPFCSKVRAMMDFYALSYDIVEVNPVLRTQIKWSEKYKKVPILIVETPEGSTIQLNDSSMIVSVLQSYLFGKQTSLAKIVEYYPTIAYNEDGKEKTDVLNKYFIMLEDSAPPSLAKREEIIEETKWRQWADSTFVHLISPNIYRTVGESIESFRHFDKAGEWEKHFSRWERELVVYVGALAMWIIGKRLKERHKIDSDPRITLYKESNTLLKHLRSKGKPFIGGDEPNLADLSIFGVLRSMEGCKAFEDLSTNSKLVTEWYKKVQSHVSENILK